MTPKKPNSHHRPRTEAEPPSQPEPAMPDWLASLPRSVQLLLTTPVSDKNMLPVEVQQYFHSMADPGREAPPPEVLTKLHVLGEALDRMDSIMVDAIKKNTSPDKAIAQAVQVADKAISQSTGKVTITQMIMQYLVESVDKGTLVPPPDTNEPGDTLKFMREVAAGAHLDTIPEDIRDFIATLVADVMAERKSGTGFGFFDIETDVDPAGESSGNITPFHKSVMRAIADHRHPKHRQFALMSCEVAWKVEIERKDGTKETITTEPEGAAALVLQRKDEDGTTIAVPVFVSLTPSMRLTVDGQRPNGKALQGGNLSDKMTVLGPVFAFDAEVKIEETEE